MGKRIVFTGGSGKAGRHCIPYLIAQGHEVLNIDLVPFPDKSVQVKTLVTDLTQNGEAFNALTSHFSGKGYESGPPPGAPHNVPDVVIHFAAYPASDIVPDNRTFAANTVSTYNIIEAACKLGVRKIIIASSECTLGVCVSQGDAMFHSFPMDEEYDTDPMDSYGLSKVCGEKIARTFARRFNADIYALRIGNVITPDDYATRFPEFIKNPMSRKRCSWSYVDARDLGQICHLCSTKDGLGFQVFNATNDTITSTIPTAKFLKQFQPETPHSRELEEFEAPMTNRKIRQVLGFQEQHNWRKYVKVD